MKLRLLALAAMAAALTGCGGSDSVDSSASNGGGSSSGGSSGGGSTSYAATVTRTTYGIPHINAADYGSLGYGYGYVFAQDNLCTMLDDFITTRGERSKYFGATGTYSIPSVPVTASNLDSDFFWKLMADATAVQYFKNGTRSEAQQLTTGYVAGFNRYITELQAGQHPGEQTACANQPWLTTISEDDMYRRYIRLALLASSEALITEIATAAPPASGAAAPSDAEMAAALRGVKRDAQPFARLREKKMGSNAYALGPDVTETGQPIVFGNPHFPWSGSERLYLVHLTVPGKMDIEGVSLYGTPIVLIGFNDHVAWSHTVSTAFRFTLYQLKLNRANPTQYYYTDSSGTRSTKDMEAVPLSVEVKNSDGTTSTQQRTLYRSMYGPMLVIKQGGIPVLGWGKNTAFTLRDANLENNRLVNQFFDWDTAQSFDDFKQLHASVLGTPWVNTVAAGPDAEKVYYGDISVVPNVLDTLAASCSTPVFSLLINALDPGLPLLDGSRSDCQWQTDNDAPVPGIFGPQHLPTLELPDWVANMNDSYWLTNPEAPIIMKDKARIIGDENTERSLRTRLGILQIERRLDNSDGIDSSGKFNLSNLQQIVLSSQIYSGELAYDDVMSGLCTQQTGGYNIAPACAVLANWDKKATLESIGLPVWQEFWNNVAGLPENYWTTPFDVNDPVNTPSGFDTTLPGVQRALYDAQTRLQRLRVPYDQPLGSVQFSGVDNIAIPIFGAEGKIGAFTVADTVDDSSQSVIDRGNGYPIIFGNSYIQTVTWDSNGVHAEGFLTYSESTDPTNDHYADFTKAYSQQLPGEPWYHFPFHASEIAAEALPDDSKDNHPNPLTLTSN
jgi:acyl-homoserine-lactone acylase